MTSNDDATGTESETSEAAPVDDITPEEAAALPPVAETNDIAAMEDAVHALGLIGLNMMGFAGAIPHLPRKLLPQAIETAEEAVWMGKSKQSLAPAQRLALLLCIDAVVMEQVRGTGLGGLLVHHFPELGSDADVRKVADRMTPEYRAFAESWIRWVYRGNAADLNGYRSVATWGLVGRLAAANVGLAVSTTPPEPEPAWQCSPPQAAFGIGACLAVAHPALGARAVREASAELQEAAALWGPRQKNRWILASKLAQKLGIEQTKPDSLRDQWEAHAKRREEPAWVAVPLGAPEPQD